MCVWMCEAIADTCFISIFFFNLPPPALDTNQVWIWGMKGQPAPTL